MAATGKRPRKASLKARQPDASAAVRLRRELAQARAQQAATAAILKVIARSPADVQPVFHAILARAASLCEANMAAVFQFDGSKLHLVAVNLPKSAAHALRKEYPAAPTRGKISGRVVLSRRAVEIPDVRHDREYRGTAPKIGGYRSLLGVPLLRKVEPIGVIVISRRAPGKFAPKQVALLKTFADQAVIAIENTRRFTQEKEALERQTATAEILKVIAGSPSDVQPVFETIAENAMRLLQTWTAAVFSFDGEKLHMRALRGAQPESIAYMRQVYPRVPGPGSINGRCFQKRKVMQTADAQLDPDPGIRAIARKRGYRSALAVPMLKDGNPIGTIGVSRVESGGFSPDETKLLQTFADQAVIAIENVRLFNETKEGLERQTATAEILKVISSSPSDLEPVFDSILSNATKLCGAHFGILNLYDGEKFRTVAQCGGNPEFAKWLAERDAFPPVPHSALARMTSERQPVQVADLKETPGYRERANIAVKMVDVGGGRTYLAVPLLKEGKLLGSISIYRSEVAPFAERQIALVKTFADQAVIAIENVRLFNETKESLERQTATAEILKVIASSPTDVQPVFEAIVQSAAKLFECGAAIQMRDGDRLQLNAVANFRHNESLVEKLRPLYPLPFDPEASRVSRAMQEGRIIEVPDIDVPGAPRSVVAVGRAAGFQAAANAPLLRAGNVIGMLSLTWPDTGHELDDKQRGMLKTFADQAVIAIENVRLFNETRESLERQTVTADILKVISSSPTDVQPVFDAIVKSGVHLFDGLNVALRLVKGDRIELVASTLPQSVDDKLPFELSDQYPSARAILRREVIEVSDVLAEEGLHERVRKRAEQLGYRSAIAAPLLRKNKAIGAITVTRATPGPFTDKQAALLKTFADQAVIAIENVRLFNETRESLERQTATAEILRVIASSPSDVQPVFDAIVQTAKRLIGAYSATVTHVGNGMLHLVAHTATTPEGAQALGKFFPIPVEGTSMGRAIQLHRPEFVDDFETDPSIPQADRELAKSRGFRSVVFVPLLRGGVAIGSLNVTRRESGRFSEHHVSLLKTFADQAVIAIENVRLFKETKESLERQTATAEILNVISRSPTDVQPVFECIVRSALRLTGGATGALFTSDGAMVDVGWMDIPPGSESAELYRRAYPMPIDRKVPAMVAMRERRIVNLPDVLASDFEEGSKARARAGDYRSVLCVPMLRGESAIGTIVVTRREPGLFDDHHVALLQAFADQAVIAIENVRLFKELQSRTEALTRSVGQLTALGEVGQAISSTLDLETVLKTIVSRAVQLTGLDGGAIYEYDERAEVFELRAAENLPGELVKVLRRTPIPKGDGPIGRTVITGEPTQIPEMLDEGYPTTRRKFLIREGYRALLVVPLLREDHAIGALSVSRKTPGPFAPEVVELLKTFATQSAMAIQNARLFREIAEKGKQLEVASRHKSDFLASMSHELRTPLNAILGFNEMILDRIYGEISEDLKAPLENMQSSGKHLLRLINNVLDLAKIEAGRMELALADYAVQDAVQSVHRTLQPLAAEKGLEFLAKVPDDVPLAYGDGGRITQCLMNLAGNSLKFTKAGTVAIAVVQQDGLLRYSVTDTGIGIAPDKIGSLFTEFKQTDATIASEYGGTGLGLSISKKFVEMHGGRIWIESELGKGSAFIFEIPLRVKTP